MVEFANLGIGLVGTLLHQTFGNGGIVLRQETNAMTALIDGFIPRAQFRHGTGRFRRSGQLRRGVKLRHSIGPEVDLARGQLRGRNPTGEGFHFGQQVDGGRVGPSWVRRARTTKIQTVADGRVNARMIAFA